MEQCKIRRFCKISYSYISTHNESGWMDECVDRIEDRKNVVIQKDEKRYITTRLR